MANEKMVTEREARIRERNAFERGAMLFSAAGMTHCHFRERAVNEYPFPKRVVPRVLVDEFQAEWRVAETTISSAPILEYRYPHNEWKSDLDSLFITDKRARLFVALFANPTEEISEDRT